MDLRTYLFTHRMKTSEFSKRIDYNAVHLYGVMSGKRKPGLKLAKIIQEATGNEVTIEELMKGE